MISLVLGLVVCLLAAAFFSGTEMAFTSANKLRFRSLADQKHPLAASVVKLHEMPQQFLISILIGSNLATVAATAIFAYGLEVYAGNHSEWVVTAIVTPLLLVFGGMVPKDYCRYRSEAVLLKYADTLHGIIRLFWIPSRLILKSIDALFHFFGATGHPSIFVSPEEFRSLVEESVRSGIVGHHEKRIIDTILDFEKVRLHVVMTPMDRVARVDLTAQVADVKALAVRTKAKVVLVYEEIPSIIVGIVHVFDLLFEENDKVGLKNYLRSPIFLPSSCSAEEAFLTLQKKRQSFSVVTDSRGNAIGIAPIERLLSL